MQTSHYTVKASRDLRVAQTSLRELLQEKVRESHGLPPDSGIWQQIGYLQAIVPMVESLDLGCVR